MLDRLTRLRRTRGPSPWYSASARTSRAAGVVGVPAVDLDEQRPSGGVLGPGARTPRRPGVRQARRARPDPSAREIAASSSGSGRPAEVPSPSRTDEWRPRERRSGRRRHSPRRAPPPVRRRRCRRAPARAEALNRAGPGEAATARIHCCSRRRREARGTSCHRPGSRRLSPRVGPVAEASRAPKRERDCRRQRRHDSESRQNGVAARDDGDGRRGRAKPRSRAES